MYSERNLVLYSTSTRFLSVDLQSFLDEWSAEYFLAYLATLGTRGQPPPHELIWYLRRVEAENRNVEAENRKRVFVEIATTQKGTQG